MCPAKPHGNARFNLEHLEEHLIEPHEGPPVDGAQIVPVVIVPVVQELLAAAREVGAVVPRHKSRERPLPVNGQPFEPFQKVPVE